MTTTTFSAGTVIRHEWLNDVDAATYHATSGTPSLPPRTLLSKFTELVSVVDFGAVGDFNGTSGTDDTLAFQAALDYIAARTNSGSFGSYSPAAGPATLFIPQGSYKITAPLVISTKIHLLGDGASEFTYGSRLTQVTANTDLIQIGASAGSTSFSMENITLRHNTTVGTGHLVNMVRSGGGTVNSQRYLNCTFAQPQAMSLYLAGDDILISNCLFDVSQQSGNCIQLGTATMGAQDVRIIGNDFFNPTNSCVKYVNCTGLTFVGNQLSQPNGSTKTPYVIDAITTVPITASEITISGNTLHGPRTLFGGSGVTSVVITGNTIAGGGIGTGENQHLIKLSGNDVAITITGNTFRGAYDTMNFYNDTAASNVTGIIIGNTFQNDGGAGDALACTKFTGRIGSNFYAGFTNRQMGEKRATTGNAVAPGTVNAGATFAFALTVPGATFGDTVNIGAMINAWIAGTGIHVIAFINAANTLRVEYRNVTAGNIAVSAHDIWAEVTR